MNNPYNGGAPIINPIFFYLADIIGAFKILLILVCLFCVIMSGVYFAIAMCAEDNECYNLDMSETAKKSHKRNLKVFFISSIVSAIFAILVPSKNLVYTMGVASFLTPDNISYFYEATGNTASDILNGGSEAIKETIDYVVDKINELRRGDNDE